MTESNKPNNERVRANTEVVVYGWCYMYVFSCFLVERIGTYNNSYTLRAGESNEVSESSDHAKFMCKR